MTAAGQRIVIIAGPNGAGKTTFAQDFLTTEANYPVFVNADLLAAGLSPFNPQAAAIRAGRVRQGGHAIREPTIRRRFEAGLRNFHSLYAPLVDAWELYDNSGREPVLLKRSTHLD